MGQKKKKREGKAPENRSKAELIVIAQAGAQLRAAPRALESAAGLDVSSLQNLLEDNGATMEPLFGASEERLLKEATVASPDARGDLGRLPQFYSVQTPEENMTELAEKLQGVEQVESAYVRPGIEPPVAPPDEEEAAYSNESPMIDSPAVDEPAAPPSFVARQNYLGAAPAGIDARFAWTRPGGRGDGIHIVDIENGFRFTHMDLRVNSGGILSGAGSSADNHGTAVLGEFSGDQNSIGVTGICSNARASGVSWFSQPTARAIRAAADRMQAGDIMLLEGHLPGPRFNFQRRSDQRGYIAIEWWPDTYLAVRDAVNRGIVVVAAGGNGAEDLDDAIYDTNPSAPNGPFPAWWRNPFRRNPLDSGSVICGAGSPPPGTHGRTSSNGEPYVDRARLGFSNYGSAVDAQGWGREVTTCGYGSLWSDPDDRTNRDRWYRDTFGGTSSASPIVVGALGCVQGVLRAEGSPLLTPALARQLLRSTGSPQQDAPGRPRTQRIGNRPNLRELIPAATSRWYNNQTVLRTHAKNTSQTAWAMISGMREWSRIRPRSADGTTDVLMILCQALANNRRVDIFLRNGQIEQANLR